MDDNKEYGSKTHFYWDGRLHRRLSVNKREGLLYAWDYANKKRVAILYSDWKRNKGLALSTNEVADLFNRNRRWILGYIKDGKIPCPQTTGERRNDLRNTGRLYWSEQDIMNLLELYESFNYWRSSPYYWDRKLPTKAEIRAKLHNTTVLYVKTPDGEFIPTWKEQDW